MMVACRADTPYREHRCDTIGKDAAAIGQAGTGGVSFVFAESATGV